MFDYTSISKVHNPDELCARLQSLETRIEELEMTYRFVLEENQELKWSAHFDQGTGDVESLEDFLQQH